jgi:hypothetical protein
MVRENEPSLAKYRCWRKNCKLIPLYNHGGGAGLKLVPCSYPMIDKTCRVVKYVWRDLNFSLVA